MVLDLEVETSGSIIARVTARLEERLTPETRSPTDNSEFFSDSFIRAHTEFDSFDAFCRACPCKQDTIGSVQRLPAEDRNRFVAETTAFETWGAMKQSAVLTDLITLQNA